MTAINANNDAVLDHAASGDNYLTHTRGFLSWAFTLDHKRIGMMYLFGILVSLIIGGAKLPLNPARFTDNLVLGIFAPSAGTMSFGGAPLGLKRSTEQRRRIQLVQQNPLSSLNPRRKVVQLHFGGGSPTFLQPDEIRLLGEHIHKHFKFAPDLEAAGRLASIPKVAMVSAPQCPTTRSTIA